MCIRDRSLSAQEEIPIIEEIPITQSIERILFVEVIGSQRIEPDTIRSYMTIKPGDLYNEEVVDQSLKILFNTGLFADVAIRYEKSGLVVFVVENPIINRVDFEGNKALKTDKFEEEVELRPRSVYTRSKVQADVQRLVELYRRSGRFSSKIEPKVIRQQQNRVDLIFEISEGPTTGVSSITGVSSFSVITLTRFSTVGISNLSDSRLLFSDIIFSFVKLMELSLLSMMIKSFPSPSIL